MQQKYVARIFVARLGLEPRYSPPEGDVLPLDDLAILDTIAENGWFLNHVILIL